MSETEIDMAHAAMEAEPENDAARLAFYERLADSELFMLLSGEPNGDQIKPELFDIQDQKFALVFDSEERLATFVGRPAPYAGLPGRGLVQMIKGQSIGLALNLEVAPSAMLIPSSAVGWLAELLLHGPDQHEAVLHDLHAPMNLPDEVLSAIGRKLSLVPGLAKCAYFAGATFDNGAKGHVLVFIDTKEGSEDALAHAAGEALNFSGIEAGSMDVMFAKSDEKIHDVLQNVGLRFDMPEPQKPRTPEAPGMNPDKPPIL